ncbi:MAG: PIG-L family deacetylase, partial [Fibrobacteria bacterium]|nr:PIG-L family deacetylase [Fibrobacteria bacterium]
MKGFSLSTRRQGSIKSELALGDMFPGWKDGQEKILFVAPHDDDIVIGAGLLLQCFLASKVHVDVVITTDGAMGYYDDIDKDSISVTRKKETENSFSILDLKKINWLHYPDCSLNTHCGRRRGTGKGPEEIAGYSGLQNSYTWILRKLRPTRIFVPTGEDLHPD